MGDNETQSGLRKAMRKVKARQIENEDEVMTSGEVGNDETDDETQSGSRKAMQKDKGKARQVENEHEVENDKMDDDDDNYEGETVRPLYYT